MGSVRSTLLTAATNLPLTFLARGTHGFLVKLSFCQLTTKWLN